MKKIRCEVYSRVVGYLRPVESWNVAKKLEFEERKTYRYETALREEKHG